VAFVLGLLVLPPQSNGQAEYYLDVNVNRFMRAYAVEEDVSDREVLGKRTWWIVLRNSKSSAIVGPELEIRTIHKPDAIRFYPTPMKTTQDGEYFILQWRFEQIRPGEERGLWLSFNEDEVFRLGANITRTVSPLVLMSQRGRLTCAVRVVSSSDMGGLWIAMRTPESEGATPKVIRAEPDLSRVMLIDDYWGWEWGWWTPNIAKNFPYAFKIEFDVLNKVYPSSVMYKPWVCVKYVDKNPRRGRTYSDQGISVQDDILGTVTWRVDGMHYWVWRQEEARETDFESVSTWPAGEPSMVNTLCLDRSKASFRVEPLFATSWTPYRTLSQLKSSQTSNYAPSEPLNDWILWNDKCHHPCSSVSVDSRLRVLCCQSSECPVHVRALIWESDSNAESEVIEKRLSGSSLAKARGRGYWLDSHCVICNDEISQPVPAHSEGWHPNLL